MNENKIRSGANGAGKDGWEKVYEYRLLYASTAQTPLTMRMELTMRDQVAPEHLQRATDATLLRYPYFAVTLEKVEGEYYFAPNRQPLTVKPLADKCVLGSKDNRRHLVAVDYEGKTIGVDFAHFLTDGDGAYHFLRTLIHYYVSFAYQVTLDRTGIRLLGDPIPQEELAPVPEDIPLPPLHRGDGAANALLLTSDRYEPVLHHFVLPEREFVAYAKSLGATPNVLAAIFADKILRKVTGDDQTPVRVVICVNERHALGLEAAHQCLVGGAVLTFDKDGEDLPLPELAKRMRASLKERTASEAVLTNVTALRGLTAKLCSFPDDKERAAFSTEIREYAAKTLSATVSYVGKANFGAAEEYVEDFVTVAMASSPLLFELSAVGGKIALDLIRPDPNEECAVELQRILQEIGIPYDYKGARPLDLPQVELPWIESER